MTIWKNITATALAVATAAALCAAPASAQAMRPTPSAAVVHGRAVMNAHKATMAARRGHPMRAKHYAAVAQRQYNRAYRIRMSHSHSYRHMR